MVVDAKKAGTKTAATKEKNTAAIVARKNEAKAKALARKHLSAKKCGESKDLRPKKADPNGVSALAQKVKKSRRGLGVVKRQCGTIQFIKKLRSLRRDRVKARINIHKKVEKARKITAQAAAVEAAKGKTTKDGKPCVPAKSTVPKFDVKKMKSFYRTQLSHRTLPSKNFFADDEAPKKRSIARLRSNLLPGTVCVVVAGRYKTRRVVFLKQLKKSGMCLVTGPYNVNGVPMRRMNQNYMIATNVRLDFGKAKVPRAVNDSYFTRAKVPKKKKTPGEEEIFQTKKKQKVRPVAREKEMQKKVDKMVNTAMKKRKDRKTLRKYLGRKFGLQGTRHPHRLNF